MSVFDRFSTTDRLILGGSLGVLLLLSYLLYDDSLLFPTDQHTEPPIGVISSMENDVRRKNTGQFIWLPGNTKDEIYNQDSIFTGGNSQAAIQLHDGSLIQIQENSLVNLNLKNGQMQLDLRFGQFTGNGNSSLRVKSGKEEYLIQGKDAKFELNRSQQGDLEVKVLSGNAKITGKAGQQKLKSNESLKISTKGAEKNQENFSIKLLTKDKAYLYRAVDKQPIEFKWTSEGSLAQYQLEVAKTQDFKKILALKTTADKAISIKDTLKEGTYFWRVKGLDSTRKPRATSAVQSFYLNYMQPPTVTSPADRSTVKTTVLKTADGLQAPLDITWTADERTRNFEWQLSDSAEFSQIIAQKNLSEKNTTTPALRQGTYFTRVRGFDKDKHPSPWSLTHQFSYEIEAEAKPPAPRLVEKRIRFQIPPSDGRAPSAETSPQMAWTPVSVAQTYQWEISKNAQFAGANGTTTPNTKIAWTQYQPGKYYFRVFARTQLGQSSAASETGVLEVFGDQPILKPIPTILVKDHDINAKAPPKETRAQWSPVADAKTYLVQMDKTPEFENPSQIEINSTEAPLTLPEPGKYYVRVKALNESSQDMSDFSNVEEVGYQFRRMIRPPKLIEPYDKTTVFLQKDMEPLIWLEWEAAAEAKGYILELSSNEDFTRILLSKSLRETRFLIKEKLPYGNIFWRVKSLAEDESMSSEWAPRQFMFYHQRNDGF